MNSKTSGGKAALAGLTSASGLVLLYASVGVLATTAGALIRPFVPGFTLVAAAVVALMGIVMLLDLRMPYFNPIFKFPLRKGLTGFFLYGIAYGFGGAGCTAPLFLALLMYAAASLAFSDGVLFFITYALGIGAPLVVTSILAAGAKRGILARINRLTPILHKVSGFTLLIVGGYLIYYYYYYYVRAPV